MVVEPIDAAPERGIPQLLVPGGIYARYSSRFQHSIKDQFRACLDWAAAHGVTVTRRHMFRDKAVSGRRSRRRGLNKLTAALNAGEIKVVIVFGTNRLFRKMYKALQFVEEQVVGRNARCVFVSSHIDTADGDRWRRALSYAALLDEFVADSTVCNIQAAHETRLLARQVYGTLSFGYMAAPIPGVRSRQGTPARSIAIDPEAAKWVQRVFDWFVREGISMTEIVRKLNAAGAPLPPRVRGKLWTYTAVHLLLGNPRYRGEWAYGRTAAVWQPAPDYVRQKPRDKPLRTMQFDELRLVDDEIWYAAEHKLLDYGDRAGRRPKSGDLHNNPRILNRVLICAKHGCPLTATGPHGMHFGCKICRTEPDRELFSVIPRDPGVRLVCEALATLTRADESLVGQIMLAARRHAEGLQKVDPGVVEALRRELAVVNRTIAFIMNAPVVTDQDAAENHVRLRECRAKRAALQARIAALEAAAARLSELPTEQEIRALLDQLHDVLLEGARSDQPRDQEALREILRELTGGRIIVTQQGERKPRRGWLRGTFRVRLLQVVLAKASFPEVADPGLEVSIDFKEPPIWMRYVERAKTLYDQDLPLKEIACKLGIRTPMAVKALKHALAQLGQDMPDGRRRQTVSPDGPARKYQQIADDVKRLLDEGMLLQDIAVRLNVADRNLITKAIRWWHESRGVPVPDGRTRRKSLAVKTTKRRAS